MNKYTFKLIIRSLLKRKVFTVINLIGLTIGISSFLILFLHVGNEKSYDKHFADHQSIYRVISTPVGPSSDGWARSIGMVNKAASYIPEIEQYTQFSHAPVGTIKIGEHTFQQEDIMSVDSTFMNLFSVTSLTGNLSEISKPNTVFISEDFARTFFKDENPLGQFIEIKELQYTRDLGSYEIRGVIKNTHPKTHFNYHLLLSQNGGLSERYSNILSRKIHWLYNYFKLKPGSNPNQVAKKLKDYYAASEFKNVPGPPDYQFALTPLTDIHLKSNARFELKDNSSKLNIRLFAIISFVTLFVSLLNFINLTIAQLIKRSKEVGLKKAIGATKTQILGQILLEVLFFCLISLILSFILIEFIRPVINQMFDISFTIFYTEPIVYLSVLLVLFICMSLSALFISFYLTGNTSTSDLLAVRNKYSGNKILKSIMIVQVSVVIILITSTLFVNKQIRYISQLNLGLDKENIVVLNSKNFSTDPAIFINELLKESQVKSVGYTRQHFGYPTQSLPLESFGIEGSADFVFANYDYLKTMQIQLTQSWISPTADTIRGIVINEHLHQRLMEEHGSMEMLNNYLASQPLQPGQRRANIIGIAKNFNYSSAHAPIGDFAFALSEHPSWARFIHVRLNPGNLRQTMNRLEDVWKNHYPNQLFSFFFLDDQINNLYQAENILLKIFSAFSGISIIICMLGVCTLSLFISEQRTKEIGIRKANGAHISQILYSLIKDYVLWVSIAFVMAVPLTWYAMNKWLENFAYKTTLDWWIFTLAGLIILFIAVITVFLQSYRAASRNPIDSLRYE